MATNPEKYYKSFYDNSPIGFYTTNLENGDFLMANTAAARILGCKTVEELLSRKSTDFYSHVARDFLIEQVKEFNKVSDYEVEIKLPTTGDKKWVSISAIRCAHGECLQGSITDISSRKDMEKELDMIKQSSMNLLKKIEKQAQDKIKKIDEEALELHG